MDIGRVLLRDAHYVWHERVALLEKDAVALQCPPSAWQAAAAAVTRSSKKTKAKPKQKPKPKLLPKQRSKPKAPPPAELLPLDGSFSCEGIVVSSAHMHSVRLQDLRSGREFLVDATTKGKKHMWIDLFSNARSRAHISSNWGGEGSYIDAEDAGETARTIRTLTLLDVQQAVEMLVTATESDAEAAVVRGCDVENILLGEGSAADFTASEAAELARKLVEEDVLLPFCCSCSFGYRVDRVYQINADHRLVKEAQLNEEYVEEVDREDGSGRCRGHLLWLHDSAFQDLLAQFDGHEDDEEGVSGTDGVQLLLRFGAYSVPTALALANELLHHELIVEGYSSDDESLDISFQMNTTARYKKVGTTDDGILGDAADVERHAIVLTERAGRFLEDRRRLEAQLQKTREEYMRLFNLFCFCCVLALLDALVTTVMLPGPLKLSLVTGLLLWLTPRISINFKPRNLEEELNRFSQGVRGSDLKASDLHLAPRSILQARGSSEIASTYTSANRRGSAQVMRQESLGRAVIVLTRAEEAEVHSFRLAIAQAAGAPVETTHVFSDEYIFSVLRVKNRSFAYAVTKMARIIKWRRIYEVDAITWDDVKSQLTSGSMYWYGYDFQNRPILWVRAKLKDWTAMSSRRDVEVRAHVYLLELGCRLFMPPGVTTYTIVTDSAGLGMAQVDLRLMRGLLDVCVANFPDRIGLVHAGPLTRFLKYVTSWLWPFLPVRLRSKVSLMHDCTAELAKHMDTDLIPLHMGGSAMHNLRTPVLNPTEADDIMEITYMIDQQKRFMEELKIQH
ncbi:CRAL-TRIO domain-containing protein C3H8.02 [Phytophthora ramorum]|uniref:CRAL-TRIO domain-containing protein C3H8.02 n=1 Tax=Phytophthora ramorum TaxID=164328 RepID=UPI0030A7D291|nr:CRAL-TRIO domain-containing protein C3H8.02 [Phytophthora ramorum]